MTARVAIVGGGMAGLELAGALAEAGAVDVEVIERGPSTRRAHVLWDRAVYPGDKKTRRWTGNGWGPEGGLSERLGGRSLCYHGVLLEIEQQALAAWPTSWSERLAGPDGLYAAIRSDLLPAFGELADVPPTPQGAAIGLRHVPQAVHLAQSDGRFRAYTPLDRARELVRARRMSIVRATVRSATPQGAGRWALELERPDGTVEVRGQFDACVLASSAIGNVQVLSRTLEREIETDLTDHICVGALVRLAPGPALRESRHHHLWSGSVPVPELRANVFVRALEPFPGGDRCVDFHAVVEQEVTHDRRASRLLVMPGRDGHLETVIDPLISDADRMLLNRVQDRINDLASTVATHEIAERGGPRLRRKQAISVVESASAETVAPYELPYGEYEHESATHPIGGRVVPVDDELGVVGAPGLYVAGPGAFPRIGAANPALTILAMSRSLATTLTARYG